MLQTTETYCAAWIGRPLRARAPFAHRRVRRRPRAENKKRTPTSELPRYRRRFPVRRRSCLSAVSETVREFVLWNDDKKLLECLNKVEKCREVVAEEREDSDKQEGIPQSAGRILSLRLVRFIVF